MKVLNLTKFEKINLIIGSLVILITAFFSEGFYHYDEHFQILEFAGKKIGFVQKYEMSWEWFEQMRPTIQPWIVIWLHRLLSLFGEPNPFYIAINLRVISGLLAIITSFSLYRTFTQPYNLNSQKVVLASSLFLWFMPFLMVRFSSENWSAMTFFLSIALMHNASFTKYAKWIIIGGGVCLSFYLRFQMAFGILGLGIYLAINKEVSRIQVLLATTGFLTILVLMVLLDYMYYDNLVFTPWEYFKQNILLKKAASFGVDPWWMYFGWFIDEAIIPFSFIILFGLYKLIRNKQQQLFSFIFISFFVGHLIVGHKELRFLFPMMYLIPFAMGEAYCLLKKLKSRVKLSKIVLTSLLVLNGVFLLRASLTPPKDHIAMYKMMHRNLTDYCVVYVTGFEENYWTYPLSYYTPDKVTYRWNDTTMNFSLINTDPHYIIVKSSQRDLYKEHIGDSVDSTIPSWYYNFNFNGWVDRETNFVMYKLKSN